jgi:hypothetical protein
MGKSITWLKVIALLAGSLGAAWLLGLLIDSFGPPSEETNPDEYPQLLQEWKERGLAAHFPPVIPREARNVKFSSLPRFLQGAGWLQLRMVLPQMQVAKWFGKYSQSAMKSFQGGCKSDHANQCDVLSTNFHTSDTKEKEFPADYLILVLGNQGSWNHGASWGLAISKSRKEVVWWAEQW